ncbi:MAG: zf-HC2 domain-containing protein [Myxococcales bacterium]|nr:zf-HC2 domain-containing protein [Myxococcales bacterium]
MSCPTELTLSIYADGELPEHEAHRIVAHLEACAACSALFTALEQENVVLMEVLGEEEAVTVSLPAAFSTSSLSASGSSASSWVLGAVAAAALAPVMLDWVWQATPTLPAGVGWVINLGGLGGVFSISRGLAQLFVGGQDMLVSSFGFVATLFVVVGTLGVVALRRPLAEATAGLALALLAALAPPSQAHAAELRYEKEGTVKVAEGESIDDTVFLAGKTAIVAGVVDGDVFAAAERVEITGTVRGNVYSAGETVTIAGAVSGNVHAAGKNVEVDTKIGGSGFLAGQNIIVTEGSDLVRGGYFAGESVRSKGRVGRDLIFAAETMDVNGSVERNVRGYGSQVTVSTTGSVGGDLHVTVPSQDAVEVDDGATVGGVTIIDIDKKEERRAFLYPGFYFGVLAKALAMLLMGLVLVTLFPSLRPPAPESSKEVLRDMGLGFVALIATPVVMLIIALTLIGIPVSIVLGVVYAVLLFLSTLVVAYFAAQRLPAADSRRRLVLNTGVSLLVILFVVAIPFVGPGLNFLVHIFGMGCLVVHLRNLYTKSHGSSDSSMSQPGVIATE